MSISSNKKLSILIILASLIAFTYIPAFAETIETDLGDNEIKLGKEAADQVAKDYKLSDNAADLKRVREIGNKLAQVANTKEVAALYGSSKVVQFKYEFNIIEESDVNAFSVPGGHIYIYRGLLNFVESDQELAGVIAHEITHAAHHHMMYLLKKQAALNNQMAIALLATMLSGAKNADMSNVLLGVQLYQIAKINGYGMEAERDADHGAVYYMVDAGYNPVGLLTFMERLAKRPELTEYGIYQNHPLDSERVEAAKKCITDLGITINRRATTNATKAVVKTDIVNNVQISSVLINDKVIFRPAPAAGKTAEQRANEVANRINNALDADLKIYELTPSPDTGQVIAAGKTLMTVTDADATLMNETVSDIVKTASMAIRDVIWKQMVDTVH